LFHLDFQRAKVAIRSGRLDEAVSLLSDPRLREHRTGQRLLDRLVDALLKRGDEHLSADRVEPAAHDAGIARQLAGHRSDVADLARRIDERGAEQRQCQSRQHRQVQLAGERIRAGALTMGENLVDAIEDRQVATRMADEVQLQRGNLSDALTRIRAALDQHDHEAAIAIYADLPEQFQARAEISDLVAGAAEQLIGSAGDALREGRLDRLARMEKQLVALGDRYRQAGEWAQALERCRRVRMALRSADYQLAQQELALLSHLCKDGDWVESTGNSIREAAGHLAAIETGPLGLLETRDAERTETSSPTRPLPPAELADGAHRCLLQVDGLGSLLLLDQPSIVIGGTTHRSSVDLRLLTDSVSAPLLLRRDGDDYLVSSEKPFRVNGREFQRKLLNSGDSIEIGRRGRLRFQQPVAASGSAVLELTAAGLARGDIRRVVLMADSLLFGPRGTHFPIESMETPVVVSLMEGQFAIRRLVPSQPGEAVPGGGSNRSIVPLRIGEPVVIDGTRFSLCPFPVAT
jgi:hypothetical protein